MLANVEVGAVTDNVRSSPAAVLGLLEAIEELGAEATGAMKIGGSDAGMVLVESGRICWAASTRMRRRLTDLICARGAAERLDVERVFRGCRDRGTPIGEALVSAGVVSEDGLCDALLAHTVEAIARLGGGVVERFVPYRHQRYDARFSYGPCQVLARLGEQWLPDAHDAALAEIAAVVGADGIGIAFGPPRGFAGLVPVAIQHCELLTVRRLSELGAWAGQLSDLTGAIDARVSMSCAVTGEGNYAFAWRRGALTFAGFAEDQRSLARALYRHRGDT